MNKAPKIGARIALKPGHRYYPAIGTVARIWAKRRYREDSDDPIWDDPDATSTAIGFEPERKWQVTMIVDEPLPKDWAYVGSNKFCPTVSEIEAA